MADIKRMIEPGQHARMNQLAGELDYRFNHNLQPKKTGFCLFVFEFGDTPEKRMNYISNANREDMIKAIEEWLAFAKSEVGL